MISDFFGNYHVVMNIHEYASCAGVERNCGVTHRWSS